MSRHSVVDLRINLVNEFSTAVKHLDCIIILFYYKKLSMCVGGDTCWMPQPVLFFSVVTK